MKGIWIFKLYDKDGKLKKEFIKENLITSAGYQHAAKAITGRAVTNDYITRMQIGTGTTEATISDTDLESSATGSSNVTVTYNYDLNSPGLFTLTGNFGQGNGTGTITEAVCRASGVTTIFNRVVFDPINKTSTDKLDILVNIDLNN